jgi:hypothetical protein
MSTESCSSHSLRRALLHLDCTRFANPSACAREARKIASEKESGTWGAVVLRDQDFLANGSVAWQFENMEPSPSKCRITADNKWLIEVFRTGWREQSIDKSQISRIAEELIEAKMNIEAVDLCPISFLRELTRVTKLSDIESGAEFLQEKARRNLGGNWNVLLTRPDQQVKESVGFDFPHYFFDSRSGFCVKTTENGFMVNIFKIGYESKSEETLQRGF